MLSMNSDSSTSFPIWMLPFLGWGGWGLKQGFAHARYSTTELHSKPPMPFIAFSYLIALVRPSGHILNKSGGHKVQPSGSHL
jgi:hypothetical protein